jgi:hypothetical protein
MAEANAGTAMTDVGSSWIGILAAILSVVLLIAVVFGVIIYRRRHRAAVPQAEATDDTYGSTFTERFDNRDVECQNPIADSESYSEGLVDMDGDDRDECLRLR